MPVRWPTPPDPMSGNPRTGDAAGPEVREPAEPGDAVGSDSGEPEEPAEPRGPHIFGERAQSVFAAVRRGFARLRPVLAALRPLFRVFRPLGVWAGRGRTALIRRWRRLAAVPHRAGHHADCVAGLCRRRGLPLQPDRQRTVPGTSAAGQAGFRTGCHPGPAKLRQCAAE